MSSPPPPASPSAQGEPKGTMGPDPAASGRIFSMDQFRGYTVAGMIIVNFVGGLEKVWPTIKHGQHGYFSYADTIMPSFMFAAGFSYRLSMLRRVERLGAGKAYLHAVFRGLALVLVSLMIYGWDQSFTRFEELTAPGIWEFAAKLIKAHLWEVLAIIGIVQILLLPVVTASFRVRLAAMAALLAVHLAISYLFNFAFVYGQPNLFDAHWGALRTTAWDGGMFGLLPWGAIMLAGTLAYDVVIKGPPLRAAGRMFVCGALLMAAGYLLSCLTTLYEGAETTPKDQGMVSAASPVLPPFHVIRTRSFASLLAAPPFLYPPPADEAHDNYWMLNKRIVSLTFVLFSTGFALVLYALFVLVCDVPQWSGIGFFRTFGQNPLAAYIIHHMVEMWLLGIVPKDSSREWSMTAAGIALMICYMSVRYLEKHRIYLRL